MLIVTTDSVPGRPAVKVFGLVNARVVVGTNLLSDFFASFSDFFGGRSGSYQNQLDKMQRILERELAAAATKRGANAVVGARFDTESISAKNVSMFMASAFGTAVAVETQDVLDGGTVDNDPINDQLDIVRQMLAYAKPLAEAGYPSHHAHQWNSLSEWSAHGVATVPDILPRIIARIKEWELPYAPVLASALIITMRDQSTLEEAMNEAAAALLAGEATGIRNGFCEVVAEHWPVLASPLISWIREPRLQRFALQAMNQGEGAPLSKCELPHVQSLATEFEEVVWGYEDIKTGRKWKCGCDEYNPRDITTCNRCGLRTKGTADWSDEDRVNVQRIRRQLKRINDLAPLLG